MHKTQEIHEKFKVVSPLIPRHLQVSLFRWRYGKPGMDVASGERRPRLGPCLPWAVSVSASLFLSLSFASTEDSLQRTSCARSWAVLSRSRLAVHSFRQDMAGRGGKERGRGSGAETRRSQFPVARSVEVLAPAMR